MKKPSGDNRTLVSKKLLESGTYLLTELLFAALFGVVLYFVFTWLAGFSILHAYFGTLAIMILAIVLEEYSIRQLESDDYLKTLSEHKGWREKLYRSSAEGFNYNVSTKTMLYLFYVIVLIFSKIVEYYPTVVSGDISFFILSNNYSILLLIALDMLVGQALSERKRMRRMAAKFREYFPENQD